MIEKPLSDFKSLISKVQPLLFAYFQTSVSVIKVVQLSEADRRNLILRLYVDSTSDRIPATFIVKKITFEKKGETEQEQRSRFARDWAGIEFLTRIGAHHAPYFYGGDMEEQFILIEDLGEPHHSLVGPLTRSPTTKNVQEAVQALEIYIRRVGKMHADSFGKTALFNQILSNVYPQTLRLHSLNEKDLRDALNCIQRYCQVPLKELHAELEEVSQQMMASQFRVLLHGDICPDNVYFQSDHMQLIDFEYGDLGYAFLDGVYLRMSMPSCWCSKTFPEQIIDQMEHIYIAELKNCLNYTEKQFNQARVYACASWVIRLINWHVDELMNKDILCPSGPVPSDSLWEPQKNHFRPRVLARLQAFVDIAQRYGYLPVLREAASSLLFFLKSQWPNVMLENYPVFLQKPE